MKKIVIFASGSGSNAETITKYFKDKNVEISLFLTNNPNAYIIERAKILNIPCKIFNKEDFYSTNAISDILININPDLIILAGFLWLFPEKILRLFPNRVINIHPALLPKYGGKGMYGDKVHKAVIENGEKESGISIHYVNEKYDEGSIIYQAKCNIIANDTPETLAQKIHVLEYNYFPEVIEGVLDGKF
ncbi:MAG: phosphoribosylglycinamide formyltransferase [Bacteroidetes bacterium RIFOXYA12_FULL_35_11]|nr:MAG: phosphoribosylglycinamide formyltransferase [Bacteroidetes bacterium GWF2_35_48]OFY73409.1 MAG: phosphoribosylglycinamide formyltransferase [Bacteroidetes bacterium RIFOXYA12_FULL_35_11]OFY93467.1 MAG: phosphoribosylglycinamide formyltransferase [Bacteroidetes bacterium RIFOXYB2_FULL_35_7]OFY96343.1 MAG: phosphoribosylglycinamide formyltransferase [Bacteroidetes bacterium RIFOXYC12_FULL_35_7]HBX51297.1 phosphoribosylglycinamide formyltransferase [Bacteroidales bacterium]